MTNSQRIQLTSAADNALRLLGQMQIQADAIIRQLTDSQLPDSAQSVRGIRELMRDASAPLRVALCNATVQAPAVPPISMRDFFALPEVMAEQDAQKANRYGSQAHRDSFHRLTALAKIHGTEKFLGQY